MLDLSSAQYMTVYNVLSFTFAAMFGAFIFFMGARSQVGEKYRPALLISAVVVAIAGYHYFRIFESWTHAYTLTAGVYKTSGTGFNDAYRYVDWLLTVPLLLIELVAVLALPKIERKGLFGKLGFAAFLMIALGYPGEISSDMTVRAVWGALSTVPFVYILYVLWGKLGSSMNNQPEEVRQLLKNIRLLLLATWGFYPITYMLPMFGISGETSIVAVQIGYAVSDVLAKAFYGLMIYWIARAKSEADGSIPAGSH